MKHGPVPYPCRCARVGSVEQRLYLLTRQMPHQGFVGTLGGDGADPPRLVGAGAEPVLQVAEQRVDGGEARVARPRRVAALAFEVAEEVEHEWGVELLDCKPGRADA